MCKHLDLQMFGVKLKKSKELFSPTEVVGRIKWVKKLNMIIRWEKG